MPEYERTMRQRATASRWKLPLGLGKILIATMCCGCTPKEPVPVLSETLDDGRQLRALITDSGSTALLVLDAQACLYCGSDVGDWQRLEREKRVKVVLVVVGRMSESDERTAKLQRIDIDRAITTHRPDFRVPSEFYIVNGSVVQRASGLAQIRGLAMYKHVGEIESGEWKPSAGFVFDQRSGISE